MQFRCPGSCRCGTLCSVADDLAGRIIGCPYSGETIRVPTKPYGENDWLNSVDPQAMLLGLPTTAKNRQLRLFALACCQRIESKLTHPLSRQALQLTERFATGIAVDEELTALSHRFMGEYNARLASLGGDWSAMNSTDLDAAYNMTLKVFP